MTWLGGALRGIVYRRVRRCRNRTQAIRNHVGDHDVGCSPILTRLCGQRVRRDATSAKGCGRDRLQQTQVLTRDRLRVGIAHGG